MDPDARPHTSLSVLVVTTVAHVRENHCGGGDIPSGTDPYHMPSAWYRCSL